MIPIEDLVIGTTYRGEGRNFDVATWNGEVFEGERYKFGQVFTDGELHWDACDRHGTFKPMEIELS
jgi:hypothetical protein